MYGLDYSRETLLATSHIRISAEDMATILAGSTIIGCGARNTTSKILLLNLHPHIETLRELYVESELRSILQCILDFFMLRKEKVAVIKAKGIKLKRLQRSDRDFLSLLPVLLLDNDPSENNCLKSYTLNIEYAISNKLATALVLFNTN